MNSNPFNLENETKGTRSRNEVRALPGSWLYIIFVSIFLGADGTRSYERGAPGLATSNKKLLVTRLTPR